VPIDYAGPPGTVAAIPYWRVYANDFPAAAVRGKIVIVGASAPRLQDLHSTPTSGSEGDERARGPGQHRRRPRSPHPLRNGPAWLDIALIVAVCLGSAAGGIRIRVWRALLASLGLAALFTIRDTTRRSTTARSSPTPYPVLTLVLAIIATLAIVLLAKRLSASTRATSSPASSRRRCR